MSGSALAQKLIKIVGVGADYFRLMIKLLLRIAIHPRCTQKLFVFLPKGIRGLVATHWFLANALNTLLTSGHTIIISLVLVYIDSLLIVNMSSGTSFNFKFI